MGILLMEKKKYILEFEEDPTTIRLVKLKNGENGLPCMQFVAVSPYKYDEAYKSGVHDTATEIEAIKDEAYKRGKEDAIDAISSKEQSIADKAYQSGLSDAWEAARKIAISEKSGGLTCREMQRIFCTDETDEIFDMSASEAIEKIRQYEQKEQESITAEDVMRQYLDTFCRERSCTGCILHTPDFTCGRGKSFLYGSMSDEEVRRAYAAVLAKMKEES